MCASYRCLIASLLTYFPAESREDCNVLWFRTQSYPYLVPALSPSTGAGCHKYVFPTWRKGSILVAWLLVRHQAQCQQKEDMPLLGWDLSRGWCRGGTGVGLLESCCDRSELCVGPSGPILRLLCPHWQNSIEVCCLTGNGSLSCTSSCSHHY